MEFEITEEQYRALEEEIASDDSPVGIDAKKTHILILHKLIEIERRLASLEEKQTASNEQFLPATE